MKRYPLMMMFLFSGHGIVVAQDSAGHLGPYKCSSDVVDDRLECSRHIVYGSQSGRLAPAGVPVGIPTLSFIDPPGGESVGSVYQVRFEATDVFGGTTIDLFYTVDEQTCSGSGGSCAAQSDCPAGDLCRHNTTIGSDGVYPIGKFRKDIPGTILMSADWNIAGIPDARYVVFAKLTPGDGADGTESSFTLPQADLHNVGDGILVFGRCGGDETPCNGNDGCAAGDLCVVPPEAVNIVGNKSRLETWTVVCIDPAGQEWRVNSTLTDPVHDPDDPNRDAYDLALTGVPYTSTGAEVMFTIVEGSVPFAEGDTFSFTTTGITDVSAPVTIHEGRISQDPVAIIHATPLSGPPPLAVRFHGLDSFDPNGEALEFVWNFGDGSPNAAGPEAFHSYTQRGVFTVVLRVANTSHRFGEAAVDIHVTDDIPSALDIKPGSCPNPLNPRSRGLVAAAVLGSDTFDVAQIDGDTLKLTRTDGIGEAVRPTARRHRSAGAIEDVAAPFGTTSCDCHGLAGDGIDDLVIRFSTPEMIRALHLSSLEPGTSVMLTIRGRLLDATPFEASDCIVIVGRSSRRPSGRVLLIRPSALWQAQGMARPEPPRNPYPHGRIEPARRSIARAATESATDSVCIGHGRLGSLRL